MIIFDSCCTAFLIYTYYFKFVKCYGIAVMENERENVFNCHENNTKISYKFSTF